MKTSLRIGISKLAILPSMLLWSGVACAQNASAGASDEIIVTAQKRDQSVQKVPIAITAIQPELARELNLSAVKDVERLVPNLRIEGLWAASAFPRVFIRGLGTSNYTPNATSSVTIVRDDVPLDNLFLQGLPSYDLERIEVLRGPQGTLQGKNSTGGSVNFISAKPKFETSGYATANYATFGDSQLEAAVTGKVTNGVAARASMIFSHDGDWQYNYILGKPTGHSTTAGGRLQLLFDSGGPLTALVIGELAHTSGTGQNPKPIAVNINGTSPAEIAAANTPGFRDLFIDGDGLFQADQHSARVVLDWHGDSVAVKSISSFDSASASVLQDDDGTPQWGSRDSIRVPKVQQFSQELRIASEGPSKFNWVVGANYLSDLLVANVTYWYGTDEFGANEAHLHQRDKSFAVFAHGEYEIVPNLTVLGGLRYTWDKKTLDYSSVYYQAGQVDPYSSLAAAPGTVSVDVPAGTVSRKWKNLSWDATLQYAFNPNVNAYAKAARGYRAGNIDGGFGFGATPGTFNPEYVTNFEGGLKFQTADHKAMLNAAVFVNNYSNLQLTIPDVTLSPPVPKTTNAGRVQITGFELEAALKPFDGFKVQATLGYQKAKFKSVTYFADPYGTSALVPGKTLPMAPNWNASFLASYEFPLGNEWNAKLGTDWSYRSSFAASVVGTDGIYGPLKSKAGVIGNVRFSVMPSKTLEFTVFIKNVTNENELTSYLFIDSPGRHSIAGAPLTKPRQIGGMVSVKF